MKPRNINLYGLFLIALIPGLITLTVLGVNSYRQQRAAVEHQLLQTARALGQALDREFLGNEKALQAFAAALGRIDRGDLATLDRKAREFQKISIADAIALTDESGQMLINTFVPFGQALPTTRNMDRVRQVFATERSHVSGVLIGTVAKQPLIAIDIPVFGDGRVNYVLNIAVLPARLDKMLRSQQLPANWIAVIYDGAGTIAARTLDAEKFVGQKVSAALLAGLSGPREGTIEGSTLEGIDVTTAYSRSADTQYSVAIGVPTAALRAAARDTLLLYSSGIAATIIAMLLLAWYARAMLMSALRTLAATIDEAAKGSGRVPIPVSGPGEIRALAEKFDHMLAARETMEEQLRKLSLAVEQSTESILITDLEARIEYVNAAFTRISGYARDEIIGQNPRLLKSGQTPQKLYIALWSALKQGAAWKGELINRRKNGEIYIEDTTIAPIRQPDGRITHYLAVKEDVTEKRRNAEELERHRHHLEELVEARTTALNVAKEAAEAANRAKTTFLTKMSHELRTPMNGIMGMADLARRRATDPKQQEQLDKLRHSSQLLLTLINEILDISRIEADRLSLDQVDFKLGDVLQNLTNLIGASAANKGLSFFVEVGAEVSNLPLRGDPLRLAQVLLNLTDNAVKFTARGSVTVRASLLAETSTDVLLRFEIQDSGIGIAVEEQRRLFTTFEQMDGSTTRKYGGAGLGLALSKQLLRMMNGDIGVDSQPGSGSRFWFTVRLQKAARQVEAQPAPLPRCAEDELRFHHAGARILLAEDEPLNQEVFRDLIEATGLAVDVAADGVEAVERATHTEYDLILMDIYMPALDGLEATRAIRLLPGRAAVPILAITASAFAHHREQCMAAGMNDFIAKPIEPEVLFDTLLHWLSGAARAAATRQ